MAWGQGLLEPQKMHSLLAGKLFARDGAEASVLNYACSGATIGLRGGAPLPEVEVEGWWPREAPRDNPTLHEQCQRVVGEHPDRRFDLILIAGGINDVNVRTIFNPGTSVREIEDRSREACRVEMAHLLTKVRTTFVSANPQVKVRLLGYYSVFSKDSKPTDIWKVLRALTIESVSRTKAQDKAAEALDAGLSLRERVIRNSLAFRDASARDLLAAVEAANAAGSGRTFELVDPKIADREAAFAPDALIWGLDRDARPQDPLAGDRRRYCDRLIGKARGLNRFACDRASVGHPNIKGAIRYAEAIYATLGSSVR